MYVYGLDAFFHGAWKLFFFPQNLNILFNLEVGRFLEIYAIFL